MSVLATADPSSRRPFRPGVLAAYVAALLLLCYVAALLAGEDPPEARRVSLRFWSLFAAAAFALTAPHLLLPDPALRLLQLLNPPPGALLLRQLRRWAPVVLLFLLPMPVLAFWRGGPGAGVAAPLGASMTTVAAAGLYAFVRYATIGPRSQAYQEGRAGRLRRRAEERGAVHPTGIPPGLRPAIAATQAVFAAGAAVVVASAYAGARWGSAPGLLPGLLLAAWAAGALVRAAPGFDRVFYLTNGLFEELFRSGGARSVVAREAIPYTSVYWVPTRWRPSVWAGLLQLDRRLPLGRYVVVGHLLLWVLVYAGASEGTLTAYLLVFSAAKNGTVYLLAAPPLAPAGFHLTLQAPATWALVRFFATLRWTLPWALSLAVITLSESFTGAELAWWTGVDVALGAIAAGVSTYFHESRYRRRYA